MKVGLMDIFIFLLGVAFAILMGFDRVTRNDIKPKPQSNPPIAFITNEPSIAGVNVDGKTFYASKPIVHLLSELRQRQDFESINTDSILRMLGDIDVTLKAFEDRITALEKNRCKCGLGLSEQNFYGEFKTNILPYLIITNLSMTNIYFTNRFGTGITPL